MTQDIEKISGSGSDISEALSVIAEKMGVDIGQLDFEIPKKQFFSEQGLAIGRTDVTVQGWLMGDKPVETNECAEFVENWLQTTFDLLDLPVQLTVSSRNNTVVCVIASSVGGQIIGKKGSTLHSIENLLIANAQKMGFDWKFVLQVEDDGKSSKGKFEGRSDSRFDKKKSFSKDKSFGKFGDRDRKKQNTSDSEEFKLKKLSKKLAQRVLETQEPVVFEGELNGFQRRIVHLAIQEMQGVATESFMDGEVKKIRIYPES